MKSGQRKSQSVKNSTMDEFSPAKNKYLSPFIAYSISSGAILGSLGLLSLLQGVHIGNLELFVMVPILTTAVALGLFNYVSKSLFGTQQANIKLNPDSKKGFQVHTIKNKGLLSLLGIHNPYKSTIEESVEQLTVEATLARYKLEEAYQRLHLEYANKSSKTNRKPSENLRFLKNNTEQAKKELKNFERNMKPLICKYAQDALKQHPELFYDSERAKGQDKKFVDKMVERKVTCCP